MTEQIKPDFTNVVNALLMVGFVDASTCSEPIFQRGIERVEIRVAPLAHDPSALLALHYSMGVRAETKLILRQPWLDLFNHDEHIVRDLIENLLFEVRGEAHDESTIPRREHIELVDLAHYGDHQ